MTRVNMPIRLYLRSIRSSADATSVRLRDVCPACVDRGPETGTESSVACQLRSEGTSSVRFACLRSVRRRLFAQQSIPLRTLLLLLLLLLNLRLRLRHDPLRRRILPSRSFDQLNEIGLPPADPRLEATHQLGDDNPLFRHRRAHLLQRGEGALIALGTLRTAAGRSAGARAVGRCGWRVADADLGAAFADRGFGFAAGARAASMRAGRAAGGVCWTIVSFACVILLAIDTYVIRREHRWHRERHSSYAVSYSTHCRSIRINQESLDA